MAEACAADVTWPCAALYLGALLILGAMAVCFTVAAVMIKPREEDE